MKAVRVALYGARGAGKSTTGRIIADILAPHCLTVSSADPLYRLQQAVYEQAGRSIGPRQQDEVVLSSLATALRSVNPSALADSVIAAADCVDAEDSGCRLVLCDDSRKSDRVYLAQGNFKFIHISARSEIRERRLISRDDIGPHRMAPSNDLIVDAGDLQIMNNRTFEELRGEIKGVLHRYGLL